MKYLFLHLEIQDGEHTHDHKILHTTEGKNIEFAAQKYCADYWGYAGREGSWWNYPSGMAGRVLNVSLLKPSEYKILKKYI